MPISVKRRLKIITGKTTRRKVIKLKQCTRVLERKLELPDFDAQKFRYDAQGYRTAIRELAEAFPHGENPVTDKIKADTARTYQRIVKKLKDLFGEDTIEKEINWIVYGDRSTGGPIPVDEGHLCEPNISDMVRKGPNHYTRPGS